MTSPADKPLIGIAPGYADPDRNRVFAPGGRINVLDLNYSRCVERAGGVPVAIPYPEQPPALREYIDRLDGLLLMGGEDLHPQRYGQESFPLDYPPCEVRDDFDLALLEVWIESRRPLFAICRGIQAVNVCRGGTLIQDIPSQIGMLHHFQYIGAQEIAHEVDIEPGSLLGGIVEESRVGVNSFHHQSIDRVGEGLMVTAQSEEGIIEAVELEGYPFFLAVQWHPERMPDDEIQMRLFESFVVACGLA